MGESGVEIPLVQVAAVGVVQQVLAETESMVQIFQALPEVPEGMGPMVMEEREEIAESPPGRMLHNPEPYLVAVAVEGVTMVEPRVKVQEEKPSLPGHVPQQHFRIALFLQLFVNQLRPQLLI